MAETNTIVNMLPRPQPVGIFPLPAGYMLIPNGPGHDEIREQLLAGKRPSEFPTSLNFYELALNDDLDGAAAALVGDDLIARTNRLVLDPSRELLDSLLTDDEIDLSLIHI